MSSSEGSPLSSTQRAAAYSARVETDERYRLLAETMPHGVVHHAANGRIIDVNPAAERILGKSRARLLGATPETEEPDTVREDGSIFPAEEHPVAHVLRTGVPVRGVVMGVMNPLSNTRRWIRIDAVPLRVDSAEPAEVYALFEDITEEKALHDAVQRSEERFRSLADNMPDVHTRFDLIENRVEYVSPSCEAVLGVTVDEMMRSDGGERSFLVDADDVDVVRAAITRIADEGKGEFEFRARGNAGDVRWYWAMVTIVRDHDGRPRYRDSIIRNVTDRKKAEQAIRDADAQRSYFVATLAHELRNPLAPLASVISILRQTDLPIEQREACVGILDRQVGHMRRLLDDLFDVSRATLGRLTIDREPIDIRTVIERAIEQSRSLIDERHHRLSVNVPSHATFVLGDADRLVQVFCNLLANAVKYTDLAGDIEISVVRDMNTVVIRVKDNGIGIQKHDMAQLFGVFGQIDASRHRSEGGLGIGLSLVKSVVELHDGHVEVQSAGHDQGTEFVVRLPVVDPPAPRAAVDVPAARPMQSRTASVLVVDDNLDGAESMSILLRASGFHVSSCHDGAAAIEQAEALRPDIVLLDLELPKVSGFDVCRAIRRTAWGAEALVVAMTGWGRDDDKARTRAAGFDLHLTKPIGIAELLRALHSERPPSRS